MKLLFLLSLALVLPAAAATTPGSSKPGYSTQSSPAPQPAKGKAGQQATTVTTPGGVTKPSAGETATPSGPNGWTEIKTSGGRTLYANWEKETSTVTLDAYIQALTGELTLSKDESQDIKTYYLDDGTKMSQILNDASLSPLQQTQQIDDLRDARNGKIEALLRDVDRQQAFLKMEAGYRVALTELAANGGLVPTTKTPTVPEPTATAPNQAEKTEKPGGPPHAAGA